MSKATETGDLLRRLERGIDYVERHLSTSIQLGQVAKHAALSQYHFHRLFRARFGVPVIEYVRCRRLTIAADRLVKSEVRILDLALEVGFESQAAFSRAFLKMYGTSPAKFRRQGKLLPWKSVFKLSDDVLNQLKKGSEMESRRMKKGKFWVAGLAKTFSAESRREIPELWDRFVPQMKRFAERKDANSFGICDGSECDNGEFDYMAGVEVDDPKKIPPGWIAKEIPAGDYLVFTHLGPISQFTKTVDYLWGTWLPNSKHKLRKAPDLEIYTARFIGESPASEVEIWVPVE